MRKSVLSALIITVVSAAILTTATMASQSRRFSAILSGFQEAPSVYTRGNGSFTAYLDSHDTLSYTLEYRDLEGESTQAHLHFARVGVNGGIIAFLCQTDDFPDPTDLAPHCASEVSGTLTSANIIGPDGQGISAGDFSALVTAMRSRAVYVNLHSTVFAAGELRGQVVDADDAP